MNQGFEDNRFPKRELLHQQRDDYDQSNTIVNSTNVNVKPKRKRESTLRKAPGAPKRFKSSYIIFFMAQRESIKRELGSKASVGEVSKKSSEKWKRLTPDEKRVWEDKARVDKERYNIEKERYTGPWQIPWKRAKKNPNAPKRPMSAFLYFSQEKRSIIKEQNPGLKNTEISRVLGQLWKNAAPEVRSPHIEHEKEEREKYKLRMTSWKEKEEERKNEERERNEEEIQKHGSISKAVNEEGPSQLPYSIQPNYHYPMSNDDHYREYYSGGYHGPGYYPPPTYSQYDYEYGSGSSSQVQYPPSQYPSWHHDHRDRPEDGRHSGYCNDDFRPIPLQNDHEHGHGHEHHHQTDHRYQTDHHHQTDTIRYAQDTQQYPTEVPSQSYRYDHSSGPISSLSATCTSFEGDEDFGMQAPS